MQKTGRNRVGMRTYGTVCVLFLQLIPISVQIYCKISDIVVECRVRKK